MSNLFNFGSFGSCPDGSQPDSLGVCGGSVGGTSAITGSGPNPVGAGGPSITLGGGDFSSTLAGLGNLFSGIGTAVASGLKAANTSTLQFPYQTATGVNTSVTQLSSALTPLLLIGGAIVVFLLIRKRG